MEGPGVVAQEAAAAAADQEHVAALRQLVHELAQGLEVALVDAAGPEALEDSRRLLVDLLQLGFGHAQADGLLLQQFAVVDVQSQPVGQRGREAGSPAPSSRDRVNTRSPARTAGRGGRARANHRRNHGRHVVQRHASRVDHQVVLGRLDAASPKKYRVKRSRVRSTSRQRAAACSSDQPSSRAIRSARQSRGATSRRWNASGISPSKCRAPRPTRTTLPRSAAWRAASVRPWMYFWWGGCRRKRSAMLMAFSSSRSSSASGTCSICGGLVQQFAVEQFPAERRRPASGRLRRRRHRTREVMVMTFMADAPGG